MEVEFELKRAREIEEDDRWSSRLEMLITVLLGIAAITAAFAAFRSEQLKSESSQALYLGQFAETKFVANNNSRSAQQIVDQNQFLAWQTAWNAADYSRGRQIRALMSDNLGKVVDPLMVLPASAQLPYTDPQDIVRQLPSDASANLAPSAASPLASQAYLNGIGHPKRDQALLRASEAYSTEGLHLSERADRYARVAIVIATALFLYGIAAVSRRIRIKLGALFLGIVVYATAVVALVLA